MASLTPVSSQACAHVSTFRDPSHSNPSSSSSPSTLETPSIYATFKVLRLVNAFRRRVTRKHTAQAATKKLSSKNTTAEDFCQDFERQAFDEIDNYLGRKKRHPSTKRPKTAASTASKPITIATKGEPAGKSIERLLQRLNQSVHYGEDSIDTIARSDRHFLQRQTGLFIDRLSVKELCELLVTVKDLLNLLQGRCNGASIEGNKLVGCSIDQANAANLQHLLLRLERELLSQLVARLVEIVHRHVSDCQKDQSKHSKEWFFEFPDARHPLSTTWPWSIKPSLAVIWGVCWMFYEHLIDDQGNLRNERGEIEIPADQVYAFFTQQQGMQPQQQRLRDQSQQQQQEMQATATRQAFQHWPHSSPGFSSAIKMEESSTQPLVPRQARQAATSLSHSPQHQPIHHAGTPEQAPHTVPGLAYAHTNNSPAYTTQPPSTYAQEFGLAAASGYPDFSFVNNSYGSTAAVGAAAWTNQGVPVSFAQQPHSQFHTRPSGQAATLPPRSRHPPTPAIITTDLSPFPQQVPQDYQNWSATSHTSDSSIPLRESASYQNFHNQQFVDSTHLSPHSPYPMADTLPPPEAQDMQTTTPPRSPHELQMQLGEQMSRKRSHSQMSNGPAPFQQFDDGHPSHPGSHTGEEEYEPGRVQVHRPEPLMNAQRKYMCNFQEEECVTLTFDRKCEWSKHMDKHDRPYRCEDPGCAKLQGFTYSGGLLRHEREVHGKHGGPKAQLMCPHLDCKRHSGKGFTRKENLNEHIRRVHANREQPSQVQPDLMKHENTFEAAIAGANWAMDETADQTPASRVSEAVMVEEELQQSPAAKRRRHNNMQPEASQRNASEDVDDLRRQIEQLQHENAQKDQRLMDMERMVAEMDRRLQEQQRAQNQWHEQQQAAAAVAAIANATQQT